MKNLFFNLISSLNSRRNKKRHFSVAHSVVARKSTVFKLVYVHKIFILDSKNLHFNNTETSFLMHIIRP